MERLAGKVALVTGIELSVDGGILAGATAAPGQ